ncbi:MAG: hypothetical protein ABR532_05855 [Candidatus Dormibacteria bacterium]
MVKVVGTQVERVDLWGLRQGSPVRLIGQPENAVDGKAILVLRREADPDAVRLALRQRSDIREGLRGSGLTPDEIRDRVHAYATAVPGFLGYLQRDLAAGRIGAEIRAGLWRATVHSVPRYDGTMGLRLVLERAAARQPAAVSR